MMNGVDSIRITKQKKAGLEAIDLSMLVDSLEI